MSFPITVVMQSVTTTFAPGVQERGNVAMSVAGGAQSPFTSLDSPNCSGCPIELGLTCYEDRQLFSVRGPSFLNGRAP